MGTPLGDFVRAKRDSIRPESIGLPRRDRSRAPGLRRSDLATRSGISVEYLTRIEQGRDRHPSGSVLNALADGLSLDTTEREHLRYLAKITGGACAAQPHPAPPPRTVRPAALATLRLLEPGVAMITNRAGDVLAHTTGFALLLRGAGLLEAAEPNLTRYVFTDPRARTLFPDWDRVADEQAFDLGLGPSLQSSLWLRTQLAPVAGPEFTRRLDRPIPPVRNALRLRHPTAGELRWDRETLELRGADAQQVVVFLAADEDTARGFERLRGGLRAVV
ncbi:helix-turn-helix domain-containing protein [Pseudonocardia sp. GCM10023141]|uniref:helix-turn-helix domain-containing protein n=1 Tax=Pseudonocardia sp. GCM10023141 TaxID=3252653 RepID=UPI003617EBD6